MKVPKGAIHMAGETMTVLVTGECLAACVPSVAADLPVILSQLQSSLSLRNVARYLMWNIRIGETVALVDRTSDSAFRLRMEPHAIHVLGIYRGGKPPEENAQVLYLINANLLRAVAGRKGVAA